jgi:hypothetical protein
MYPVEGYISKHQLDPVESLPFLAINGVLLELWLSFFVCIEFFNVQEETSVHVLVHLLDFFKVCLCTKPSLLSKVFQKIVCTICPPVLFFLEERLRVT